MEKYLKNKMINIYMPKKKQIKQQKKPQVIDFFYRTDYSATTVNEFTEIWNKVYNRIPCLQCKINPVEIKKEIFDIHEPRFGILRKNYCLHCWLQKVSLTHDPVHKV